MGNWKTLDVMSGMGQGLGNLANSITGFSRRKARSDLEDQALKFKVGTQGEQFNREGRKLNLDFSRLDHDINSQAQDYDIANRNLADRPMQRAFEAEQTDVSALNRANPFASSIMRGRIDGEGIGQLMHMEKGRQNELAGSNAYSRASGTDAVSRKRAEDEELWRFAESPEVKDLPKAEIAKLWMKRNRPGVPTKPSGNMLSDGEALKRDKRATSRKLFEQLSVDDDKRGEFDALFGKGASQEFLDANRYLVDGAAPVSTSAARPAPTAPVTQATEAPVQKARRIAAALGFSQDDNEWTDEQVEAIRAEMDK